MYVSDKTTLSSNNRNALKELGDKEQVDLQFEEEMKRQDNGDFVLTLFLCVVLSPTILFMNRALATQANKMTSLKDLYQDINLPVPNSDEGRHYTEYRILRIVLEMATNGFHVYPGLMQEFLIDATEADYHKPPDVQLDKEEFKKQWTQRYEDESKDESQIRFFNEIERLAGLDNAADDEESEASEKDVESEDEDLESEDEDDTVTDETDGTAVGEAEGDKETRSLEMEKDNGLPENDDDEEREAEDVERQLAAVDNEAEEKMCENLEHAEIIEIDEGGNEGEGQSTENGCKRLFVEDENEKKGKKRRKTRGYREVAGELKSMLANIENEVESKEGLETTRKLLEDRLKELYSIEL